MTSFGIGEIARRAQIATSTIRYYERIGLLPPSARVSGKRRYDLHILGKLALIRAAQEAGFSLDEIHGLLYGFSAETPPAQRWHRFADTKIRELDAAIQHMQMQKAFLEKAQECHCPTLDVFAKKLHSRFPETALSLRDLIDERAASFSVIPHVGDARV